MVVPKLNLGAVVVVGPAVVAEAFLAGSAAGVAVVAGFPNEKAPGVAAAG